jgi:hypothetical protein
VSLLLRATSATATTTHNNSSRQLIPHHGRLVWIRRNRNNDNKGIGGPQSIGDSHNAVMRDFDTA